MEAWVTLMDRFVAQVSEALVQKKVSLKRHLPPSDKGRGHMSMQLLGPQRFQSPRMVSNQVKVDVWD